MLSQMRCSGARNNMQTYKDLSGKSGVSKYEIAEEYIDIEFHGGVTYRYSYVTPGREQVEIMKHLALSGDDLATFINKNVRKKFAARLR